MLKFKKRQSWFYDFLNFIRLVATMFLVMFVICMMTGILLLFVGCIPEKENCEILKMRCDENAVEICSKDHEWELALNCSEVVYIIDGGIVPGGKTCCCLDAGCDCLSEGECNDTP